jgi:hypothetical protein
MITFGPDRRDRNCQDAIAAAGLFLLSLTIYALLSPGRIDIIDGQWRYEIAHSIVTNGSVAISDPALMKSGLPGLEGKSYGFYGLSGSLIGVPLVAFAELVSPNNRDLAQFLFSMVSPILSGATIAILFLYYRSFEITRRSAVVWSLVFGFSTLFFPLATSVFDQAQNAFCVLVAFAGTHLAYQSRALLPAVVGAIAFVVLINYKEAYIALSPGLLWVAGLRMSSDIVRELRTNSAVQIVVVACLLGLAGHLGFNLVRFGHLFPPPSLHPPVFDDFLVGLVGLTVSPGKGLLWYSPSVLLVALGWRRFRIRHPDLAIGISIAIVTWIILVSSLSFFGGDWCWGPRYWVPILPLLFIAAPFASFSHRSHVIAAATIVALSFGIQCLALAVDHQRFFFARNLTPFFWYQDSSFYYENSALISRFTEIVELEWPENHKYSIPFRPGPHPDSLTYAIFGPETFKERMHGSQWMEQYPVFFLPRPWPLWTTAIEDSSIQALRGQALGGCLALTLGGILLLRLSLKIKP